MAGLTCIFCQAENEPGEQLCRACFRRLPAAEPAAAERPAAPEDPASSRSDPVDSLAVPVRSGLDSALSWAGAPPARPSNAAIPNNDTKARKDMR